jgi:hypothetical protein
MGFSIDTGFGEQDPIYSSFGAGGYAVVDTDVSYGSPDEQPSTPTGNGTGTFLSGGDNAGLWSTLQSALQYAIVRDQQKMTAVYGPSVPVQGQAAVTLQAQADRRLLTLLMIGGALFFLAKS